MHPPLHLNKHPHCREAILRLVRCHKQHPVAKFWGVCNEAKRALDACFREEKVLNRQLNKVRAAEEKERFQHVQQEVGRVLDEEQYSKTANQR